ncbi:integral membrane protein MviN [Citrobacter koseri]|uniref:Integral membrane protein MviN n=1 Tax=Citrobacter koseri TaxID=545 RepID=A0A2X2YP11_CITKO|nr:integral membrane protein MviN [Citrobacter koseri]
MNLLKSLAAVSSMTMFSRVLGFARDAIVARIFGAGMATDAFFVAFKLPNLLRRIFAEGAFSQAFVPILAEYKSKQGEEATRGFCRLCLRPADPGVSRGDGGRYARRAVGDHGNRAGFC